MVKLQTSMATLIKATQNIKTQIENQSSHSFKMNQSFALLKTAMDNLRDKTQLQQQEDSALEEAMHNLHLVKTKNSEAVDGLMKAVQG